MSENEVQITEAEEAKPSSAKAFLMGSMVTGTLMLALGAAGYFVAGPTLLQRQIEPAAAECEVEANSDVVKPKFQIDNLIINPAGAGGTRYLAFSVVMEVEPLPGDAAAKDAGHGASDAPDPALAPFVAKHQLLQARLIRHFSSKPVSEFSAAGAQAIMEEEAKTLIQGLVPEARIGDVYFPQYFLASQ